MRIVLGAALGTRTTHLAQQLDCTPKTVGKWRGRWRAGEARLAAAEADRASVRATIADVLADAPRAGAPGRFSAEQIIQLVNLACTAPSDAHRPIAAWTPRALADAAIQRGIVPTISPTTVGRFLKRG